MRSSSSTGRLRTVAALALVGGLAVAACGSDSDAEPEPAAPEAQAEEPTADEPAAEEPAADGGEDAPRADFVAQPAENQAVSFEGDPLAPFQDAGSDAAVGAAAPVVDGADFDGRAVRIGEATGSPTLLVFLAHWCPHCNDEIPELIELRDDGRLPADLDVVGISTAVASDRDNYPPSEWALEKEWTWPMMADDRNSTAIQVYGGTSFPFSVLLDGDGQVVARRAGASSADATADWLESSLA